MRDDDRQASVIDRRFAIAVFRCDVDLDREPREALDPILADEPGHVGGAAGDDREAREFFGLDRPGEGPEAHRRHVDVMGERVADDLRLLVDLLGHEVPVIAPFREQASGRAALDHAPDPISGAIADVGPLAGQYDPIAFLEIGDTVGERRERERVGTQIHLAVAVADRERRALPRADQQVVLTLEQIDERESAAQALERRMNRLLRRLALSEFVLDQERGDLEVRLGRERMTLGGELVAQRSEVFDDAVVDHGEVSATRGDGRWSRSACRASPTGCGRCRSRPREDCSRAWPRDS